MSVDQQRAQNVSNLQVALRKMELRITEEATSSNRFTTILVLSVQNGVLRTAKIAVEEGARTLSNANGVAVALQRIANRIKAEMERTAFFTATLTVSVIDGIISHEVAAEECEHFHAKA